MSRPQRVVTDSMLGLELPDVDTWSERVSVVLGQNPGMFTGPGTNTYLVGTGKRRLLLDTGQGVPAYLDHLERGLATTPGGDEIECIVATHGHPDHTGGAAGIRERFGDLELLKMPWPALDGDLALTALDDGCEIRTEGATLRGLWTPGHARDHLCFYLEEERAVFSGDNVLGAGTTVISPETGDLGDYLESLRKLLALDMAVIYPAHGPAIRNPHEKVQQYLAHRELREQQILDELGGAPRTVPQLVAAIYTDVPEFLHQAAGASVLAHLRKLEREGRAAVDGAVWALT